MKTYTCQLAKIVGTTTASTWSQVHSFTPEDQEKKQKRGTLLAVILLSQTQNEDETEMVNVGREIISRLHEEYYGEIQAGVLDRLTQTLNKIQEEFGQAEKLEVILGIILGEVLYLAILGGGKIIIKRGSVFQEILAGLPGSVENASGFLQDQDVLILGTSAFFSALPEGVLRAALANPTPEAAAEAITPLVCGRPDDSFMAGLLVKITPEEEINQEEQKLPEEPVEMETLTKRFDKFDLRQILRKISARFPQNLAVRLDSGQDKQRRRVVFTVAVILIILLGISVFFGKEKRINQEKASRYNALYEEISRDLEDGKSLMSLNPLKAKELIMSASTKIGELEALNFEKEKTQQIKQLVNEALPLVVKEYKIENPPLFLDLALFRQNGRGDQLALINSLLAVLDKEEKIVFNIDVDKKSGEILAGAEDIPGASLISGYSDQVFILGENGLTAINAKTKKRSLVLKSQDLPKDILAMKAFGGNLYFVSKDNIWRSNGSQEGFDSPKTWLAEGLKNDFSNFSSMAIDGAIWLLTKEGNVQKFVQGSKVGFGPAGLDKDFSQETLLFTDFDNKNLYFLDRGNSRLVVLAKNGEYQKQYLWQGLKDVTDFAVSEKLGKVFLLASSKIWEIELK